MVIITECGKIIYEDQIKYLYPETNEVQIKGSYFIKTLFKIKEQRDHLIELLDLNDFVIINSDYSRSNGIRDFRRVSGTSHCGGKQYEINLEGERIDINNEHIIEEVLIRDHYKERFQKVRR